jgi:hypothetical protein
MPQSVRSFEELFQEAERSAVHLEMRDSYAVGSEAEDVATWRTTGVANVDPESEYWKSWVTAVRGAVERGVHVRRARIVSQPVADYIRYEHAITVVNLAAGEQVRWLPRRQASNIALPGNDFWLFDERLVRINHFTGEGDGAAEPFEDTDDQNLAQLCSNAFEAVWERAVPHADFTL